MSRKWAVSRARAAVVGVLAGALCAVACSGPDAAGGAASDGSAALDSDSGDAIETAGFSRRSLCPECPLVPAGGESSDFGGTPHPCALVEQSTLIDADAAARLGFDVPTLVQLVERDFDEALRWTPEDTGRGTPPAGYEEQTRVQGRAQIISYSYVSLEPKSCDGTNCWIDGQEWECADRLELGIEAELRTLDGAVEARAIGYAFQGRPGFPFESPAGTVFANLRDVRGSLQLSLPQGEDIQRAVLITDLFYKPERIEGDIHAYVLQSTGPSTATLYYPIGGHWPDVESAPTPREKSAVCLRGRQM